MPKRRPTPNSPAAPQNRRPQARIPTMRKVPLLQSFHVSSSKHWFPKLFYRRYYTLSVAKIVKHYFTKILIFAAFPIRRRRAKWQEPMGGAAFPGAPGGISLSLASPFRLFSPPAENQARAAMTSARAFSCFLYAVSLWSNSGFVLQLDHVGINAFLFHQLLRRSLFRHSSVFQNNDLIRSCYCPHAMGYHHHGFIPIQRRARFGSASHSPHPGRLSLVQQNDGRILQKRPAMEMRCRSPPESSQPFSPI